MKKITTLFICLLLLAAATVGALAASPTEIRIHTTNADIRPGDSVEFIVSMNEVTDCRSGGIVLNYDSNIFEFVSGQCLVSNPFMSDFSDGTGVFAFTEGRSISGNIFKFTLRVKSTAPRGDQGHTVSASATIRTGSGAVETLVYGAVITLRCDHSYQGWTSLGENAHQRTCSTCGAKEESAHNWDQGRMTKEPSCKKDGTKTFTCTDCGAVRVDTIEKLTDHTYDSSCDPECNVCGNTREISHHYADQWHSNPDAHWHTCSICGEKADQSSHTPGNAATESSPQTCSVCAWVLAPQLQSSAPEENTAPTQAPTEPAGEEAEPTEPAREEAEPSVPTEETTANSEPVEEVPTEPEVTPPAPTASEPMESETAKQDVTEPEVTESDEAPQTDTQPEASLPLWPAAAILAAVAALVTVLILLLKR